MADKLSVAISRLRRMLDDEVGEDAERLVSDAFIVDALNEGRREFCREADIFLDASTVSETLATAIIDINGTAGQISSVKVNGITITSAAVPFNVSLSQTATDLATNINAYTSTPNYTAVSSGDKVTVSAVAGTGARPNGYTVVTAGSGGLTAADTAMGEGTSLCRAYLLAGDRRAAIDPRVIRVVRAKLASQTAPLTKKDRAFFDGYRSSWATATGTPDLYALDIEDGYLYFSSALGAVDTLELTAIRHALIDLSTDSMSASLEVSSDYTQALLHFAAHAAYTRPDSEIFRPELASYHIAKFEAAKVKAKRDGRRRRNINTVATVPQGNL